MRRIAGLMVVACCLPLLWQQSASAADFDGDSGGSGGSGYVGASVTPDPGSGSGTSGGHGQEAAGGGAQGVDHGGGGGHGGPARHPGLTYEQCVAFLDFTEDRSACQPAAPGPPPAPGAPAPAAPPTVDPGAVAARMRERMPVEVPPPHTSPPADGFQLTGLRTWFWLDAERWAPVTARADVAGAWIEVTATPTTATWDPGDGAAPVRCDGPARPWAGEGSTTTCGHTYIETGDVTIGLTVTYAVSWTASTGATGSLDPLALTTTLPLEVQQRQAVID